MSSKNRVSIGKSVKTSSIYHAPNRTVRIGSATKRASKPQGYPASTIGAHALMCNYVKYLIDRYQSFRQTELTFGKGGHRYVTSAVLFKNIEREFKAPAYFVPAARFSDLAAYLHSKIDRTALGKRNHARGIANYRSWDEFQAEQTQTVGNDEA